MNERPFRAVGHRVGHLAFADPAAEAVALQPTGIEDVYLPLIVEDRGTAPDVIIFLFEDAPYRFEPPGKIGDHFVRERFGPIDHGLPARRGPCSGLGLCLPGRNYRHTGSEQQKNYFLHRKYI